MAALEMVNSFLQDILTRTLDSALKHKLQKQTSKIPIKQQSTLLHSQMYKDRDIISSYWSKRDGIPSRRQIDVRCVDNMKNFRNKIKSYYINITPIKPNMSFVKESPSRLASCNSRINTAIINNINKTNQQLNIGSKEMLKPNNLIINDEITLSCSKQKLQKEVKEWINKFNLCLDSDNIDIILNTFVECIHQVLNKDDIEIECKLMAEINKFVEKLKTPSIKANKDMAASNIVEDLKNNIICLYKENRSNNIINKGSKCIDLDASSIKLLSKTSIAVNTGFETLPDIKHRLSNINSLPGMIKAHWTTCRKTIKHGLDFDFNLEKSLSDEIQLILHKIGLKLTEVEIADVISKLIISAIYSKADVQSVKEDICNALYSYTDLPLDKEESIADSILDNVTLEISDNSVKIKHRSFKPHESQFSGVITVYTSEEKLDSSKPLLTSTPKKKAKKKDVPKMNKEETEYYDKVVKIVTKWLDTLPKQFNKSEDKNFKDTMIHDLSGSLVDEVKEEQIYPKNELELTLKSAIMKWTQKFSIYNTTEEGLDKVEELYNKIMEIPAPKLTKPHHGNRQVMENLKYIERDNLLKPDYIPAGGLHIEDEISIWMNEQPEDIYTFKDRTERNKLIHDLAETIHKLLRNKRPEKDIKIEVEKFLTNIISDGEKPHLKELVEDLKDRVKNMPLQDAIEKTMKERILSEEAQRSFKISKKMANLEEPSIQYIDPNTTMQEFIHKFIEHNCNVANQLKCGALQQMLRKELIKLSAPTRKELYENFSKPSVEFLPERFFDELDYMSIVSDWLNTLPLHPSYKRRGNNHRIEFITNIVTYIADIEEERKMKPNAMNYDDYLADIIDTYVRLLAIPAEQQCVMMWYIKTLMSSLTEYRMKNQNKITPPKRTPLDLDSILNEFIQKYAQNEDDPLKMEVYTARLMEEAKRIIHETSNPEALSKTQVYNQLHAIAQPGNETINRFEYELIFIEEITDWLLNLPLLPIVNENDEENRASMISELSEKIYERFITNSSIDDTETNVDFVQYIKNWIEGLPLDKNYELVMPVAIHQLLNRIEKCKKEKDGLPLLNESLKQQKSTSIKCNTTCPKNKQYQKDPGKFLLEELNKFVNGLPLKSKNDDEKKESKEKLVTTLFKKIGDLNNDQNVFNNDNLYKEMLISIIDSHLQDLAETPKNLEKTKSALIENVIDIKNSIKEKIIGDVYRKTLEDTVHASIPNPIPNQVYHPGFEIYKSRLVEMFILDNFDHTNDDVKLKYEQRLKIEIDKYFQSAQSKNALPLTKDQIYNELYSALFKVPVPHEASVIGVLEEVKTRCVVDEWFEILPIQNTDDLILLLEWDKLLSTLSKRICEIERNEQKPDEKIKKEIKKLLEKLPLLPGNENKIDELTDKLHSALKSNAGRKNINSKDRRKDSKGKSKSKSKTKMTSNDIVASDKESDPTPASSRKNINPPIIVSPADIIVAIVNKWCEDLPLHGASQEQEAINNFRQYIALRIIMKISELNSDPKIFADDYLYNALLDEHLEKLLSALPMYREVQEGKEARKHILKQLIGDTKGFVAQEKARYDYKQSLKDTVKSILEEQKNATQAEANEFSELVEEIINEFLLYYYQDIDIQEKQKFKMKLYDAVVKYFVDLNEKGNVKHLDPLIVRNQIICELARVTPPSQAAVYQELVEVVLKVDVKEFIIEAAIADKDLDDVDLKNDLHRMITKKLIDLQRNGLDKVDDSKLKSEIDKCMKKVNKEVNPALVNKLVRNVKGGPRKVVPLGDIDDQSVRRKWQIENQSVVYDWHKKPESPKRTPPARRPSMDTSFFSRTTPQSPYNVGDARSLPATIMSFPRFEAQVALSSSKNNRPPINLDEIEVAGAGGFELGPMPSSGDDGEAAEATDLGGPPPIDNFQKLEVIVPPGINEQLQFIQEPAVQQNENVRTPLSSEENDDEEKICMCIRKRSRISRRPSCLARFLYEDFDDCRPLPRSRCRMPLTGFLIY